MKPNLIIGGAIVALFASCSHLGRNEVASSSPRAEEIRAAMDQTVIPEVDLQNMNTEAALKTWSEKSRTYHPKHFRFQHILSYPMTFSQGAAKRSAVPLRAPTVTVRRKNITSKRLLDEICRQADMVWTVAGKVVLVRPRGSVPDGRQ